MTTEDILPTNTERGREKGEGRERERDGERKRTHNPLEALGPALRKREKTPGSRSLNCDFSVRSEQHQVIGAGQLVCAIRGL